MDDFRKYELLRNEGAPPSQIYLVAKSDGIDAITLIRLLRKVCGLSLAEVKKITGAADALETKQEPKVGGTVYWEGWGSWEGDYLCEARVTQIENGRAEVEGIRKHRVTATGLEETPVSGDRRESIPLRYFDKTLAERLGESLKFVGELARVRSALDRQAV